MRRQLYILMTFVLIPNIYGQSIYFGKNSSKIINAKIIDSIAFVEICTRDFKGTYNTHFDTLHRIEGMFKSQNSKILLKNGLYLFNPGKIQLYKDSVDISSNKNRIIGYQQSRSELLFRQLEWMDYKNMDTIRKKFHKRKVIDSVPEIFYNNYDSIVRVFKDSIYSYYYLRFNRVEISNDRFLLKRDFANSSDSTSITEIWKILINNQMFDKKSSNFYMYQYQAMYLVLGIYNPWLFLISPVSWFAALSLTELERFIINRILSRKTFVISFYNNDKKLLKIKVRDSYIVNNYYYKYKIGVDFNKKYKKN